MSRRERKRKTPDSDLETWGGPDETRIAEGEDEPGRYENGGTGLSALVVHPALRGSDSASRQPEARLAEAVGLAAAIELRIADALVVPVPRPKPATLFGRGSVDAIAETVERREVTLVVVDAALTPVQQRNLERAWSCKVIDRTGLILEIFGARARTKEGALQVELASLTYQRSRLVRSWTHLERQRGGFGFLGGPGESQLEMDRRLITDRITRIKGDLERVKKTRKLHREARQRVPYPVVALVGYTNAGKSTLFNRLTRSEVFAQDLLFATLDPTMRKLRLGSGEEIILSDTVGFISDLPTDLVAAFRATLEEVTEADLILHVRDIAHPDSEAQADDVRGILADLGLEEKLAEDVIEVLNKIDLLTDSEKGDLANRTGRNALCVAVSAVTGEGLETLLQTLEARLQANKPAVTVWVPATQGAALAWLYDHGQVIERDDRDHAETRLSVRLRPADLARFQQRFETYADRPMEVRVRDLIPQAN